jgi:hypothetical protein
MTRFTYRGVIDLQYIFNLSPLPEYEKHTNGFTLLGYQFSFKSMAKIARRDMPAARSSSRLQSNCFEWAEPRFGSRNAGEEV